MRKLSELGLVLLCTGLLLAASAAAQTNEVRSAAQAQADQANVAAQLETARNAPATGYEKPDHDCSDLRAKTATTSSFATSAGRISSISTRLNAAEFAPMPTASTTTATAVKPKLRTRERAP